MRYGLESAHGELHKKNPPDLSIDTNKRNTAKYAPQMIDKPAAKCYHDNAHGCIIKWIIICIITSTPYK